MAEESSGRRPLLRPVLRFTKAPQPAAVQGGGKGRKDIRADRIGRQQGHLASVFEGLASTKSHFIDYEEKTLVCVSMFDDSHAPSWLPSGLFNLDRGAKFVVPYRDGYLIQIDTEFLKLYSGVIRRALTIVDQVDISRVRDVRAFSAQDALAGRGLDQIWDRAPEHGDGRLFFARLLPLRDRDAAETMIGKFQAMQDQTFHSPGGLLDILGSDTLPMTPEDRAFSVIRSRGDRLALALRAYRRSGQAGVTVVIKQPEHLEALVGSGTLFRIDPSPRLVGSPGMPGGEPDRPLPAMLEMAPIVGVVDGGLTAESYRPAEAWAAPPLIRGRLADARHGNQISSIIIHGHDWNGTLTLPPLYCRVGTVQALSKLSAGATAAAPVDDLIAYLEAIMMAHPETQVWNFSMNQLEPCDSEQVSYLGHELAKLARRYSKLPVISVGNGNEHALKPPADCEAALTVGGHLACLQGGPGAACPISLPGPGPCGMLKPDVTNFSHVRAIGGASVKGSSFSAGLTSSLAAHTMMRLSDPSPDMVRALLIHNAQSDRFTPTSGFGSVASVVPPWECDESSATLMWQEDLRQGAAFYWDVPIPPALIRNGKLSGFGALTAVLNPHPLADDLAGPNYFGVRVNTALQYQAPASFKNLLGSIETDQMPEMTARDLEHKWSPVRHHQKDFGTKGLKLGGPSLRVFARIYVRDLYAFGFDDAAETPPFSVSFVLTLRSRFPSDLYDQMVTDLREYVEPGIIDADIQIEGGA
tara:strand:+ start:2191 stop:4452 length:2262 start_codon:yes stop_codon:yes gene_type:complete